MEVGDGRGGSDSVMDQEGVEVDLSSKLHDVPLVFSGQAGEYFKIWIVNIFLTVLTLGIYSPWAKVRTKRYFYGCASIEGSSFEYLAEPLQILKGRLLVLLFMIPLVVSQALAETNPVWAMVFLVFLLIYMILMPWFIVKGRMFNLRNTAFRNIRFRFKGTYGQSCMVYMVWALTIPFSMMLTFPVFLHSQNHFFINNSRFGLTPFKMNSTVGDFYRRLIALAGVMILIYAIPVAVAILIPKFVNQSAVPVEQTAESVIYGIIGGGGFLALILFARAYWISTWGKLVLNSISFNNHYLSCHYRTLPLMALLFTNLIGVIFSLGLAIPWAKIRTSKYQWEHVTLHMQGSLDDVLSAEIASVGAFGEEAADGFDLDVGVGG